jgi:type II secretory pathway component PulM
MSLGGLAIAVTMLVIVVLWIVVPLLDRRRPAAPDAQAVERQRERLLANYERTLRNIRDLDEDYATGKIQPEDYQDEREPWVQRGIQLLMAMDRLEQLDGRTNLAAAGVLRPGEADRTVDEAIEAAVAARRKKGKPGQAPGR